MAPTHAAAHTAASGDGGGNGAGRSEVLALNLGDLRQLFNSMDPAPFRERDLDPQAEDYIVGWAQEVRTSRPLALQVQVGNPVAPGEEVMLREAVDEHFRRRAQATKRRLKKLFRVGRISLLIGLAFLGGAFALGEALGSLLNDTKYVRLIQESFVIGGWVALWRPLEIFLYDWWPIRGEVRLFERLGVIDVRVLHQVPEGRSAA